MSIGSASDGLPEQSHGFDWIDRTETESQGVCFQGTVAQLTNTHTGIPDKR